MPEIGTYPLFPSLVDDDSFLGVSSVNGKTYRGSVRQLTETVVGNNIAQESDLPSNQNQQRIMSVERSKQLLDQVYRLPRRLYTQEIFSPVANVTVPLAGTGYETDMWVHFRNMRFNYSTAASATIRLELSYDNGSSYPTTGYVYQATVIAGSALAHGHGANQPIVLIPGQTIGNPVRMNMVVRVSGGMPGTDLRMIEWRGVLRYVNNNTHIVAPFWGAYATTANEYLATHLRLRSAGGEQIERGFVAGYRSPVFL